MKDDELDLPPKDVLERQKLKSEKDKIENEIAQAKKPLFYQREFYTAILPIAFGLFGLVFSWASGYFDNKLGRLELERMELSQSVAKLKSDSLKLYGDYMNRASILDGLYKSKRDSLDSAYRIEIDRLTIEAIETRRRSADEVARLKNATKQELNEAIGKLIQQQSDSKSIIEFQEGRIKTLTELVYNEKILAADRARDDKEVLLARIKYQEAIEINPKASYPAEQIKVLPEVTDIKIAFSPELLNCSSKLTINLGGTIVVPYSNDYLVRNVKVGPAKYVIAGVITCLPGGSYSALGSGTIVVTERMTLSVRARITEPYSCIVALE